MIADRLMESPLQEATAVDESKPVKLTIGIATHDDFDGAWFTINSLYLHHAEAMDEAEVVLLDNHPRGIEASELKHLDSLLPNVRYVPIAAYSSTAIRNQIFSHARGELVVVLDSHVLLAPGALKAVIEWFSSNPGSNDLVQGPLIGPDNRRNIATHMNPIWNAGMFGKWGLDERADDPNADAFEIPQQGLAAFACLRDSWPGLSTKFVGFGGEEGYVHEKFRRRGGKVLCLPAFRWQHRFPRPKGVTYRLNWPDRVRNYAIGWTELGLNTDEIAPHFVDTTGLSNADEIVGRVRRGAETAFWSADGVVCVNDDLRPGLWKATVAAFQQFGIAPLRVSRPDGGTVEDDLRAARELAAQLGWESAVVVGERTVLEVGDIAVADSRLRASSSGHDRDTLVSRIELRDT